ncbi:MAG: DUF362 domain-containing protein [Promethearchaeota archaeon]
MKDQPDTKSTEVAIVKGNTPKESVQKGIEKLGGISNFIKEGDNVFIKFNLCLPSGFPTNTNFDVLKLLITLCKDAGANKIYLGSFPFKGIPVNTISNLLNLKEFISNLGAELVYLDNSNTFNEKNLKKEQWNKVKREFYSEISQNDKKLLIPKLILSSDKIILINQINVDPLFKLRLSLLNFYSIIPPRNQEVEDKKNQENNYISLDQYKKDLISNILDVYAIKQPNLVINDCFYLLEGAGPYIYRDSNLKTTGVAVVGNNAISTDLITLKLCNVDTQSYNLILEANKRNLGIIDPQKINLFGENIEDFDLNINFCVSKLEDIKIKNNIVYTGHFCSGCYKQAYHLLNFMKTYMTKDLKYNPRNAFLIGKNPVEPAHFKNVLLFGDCAINSTKDSNFRKIRKIPKKPKTDKKKSKKNQKLASQKNEKIKVKSNKRILDLPGCPPDIFDCLKLLIKFYGKKNLPNLVLINKLIEIVVNPKVQENLKAMGVI